MSDQPKILDLKSGIGRHDDRYVVCRASYDSISHSCDLADPVTGGGLWCHSDHFTGNPLHQCHCRYFPTHWEMTHPGQPLPEPGENPNFKVTYLDENGAPIIDNLIHRPQDPGRGNSGEKIPVRYCRRCQHHRVTNPDDKLWEQVRVCLSPAHVTDGTPPTCRDARTVDGKLTHDCPDFVESQEADQ